MFELVVVVILIAITVAYLLFLWWKDWESAAYRRQRVLAEQLKAEQAIQGVMQHTLAQMFAEARVTAATEDATPDTRTND